MHTSIAKPTVSQNVLRRGHATRFGRRLGRSNSLMEGGMSARNLKSSTP